MNDELSSKLAEILGAMQTAVGAAKDFTLAQLPDIAQSYVIYGRVWYLFLAAIGVAIFIAIWVFAVRANNRADDFNKGLLIVVGGIVSVIPATLFIVSVKNAMLVWFAPKVWLMIKLGELIGGR